MTYFKFVDSLEKIEKVKNSVYQVSKDSYIINQNMMIFSCLAKINYQLNESLKNQRVEIVLTCLNREFTCIIKDK